MGWPECTIPTGVFVPGAVLDEQSQAVSVELGCSPNEAAGIIITLWMYASGAADANGFIQGNRHALWSSVIAKLDDRIDANTLPDHLEKAGVINQTDDGITVVGFCEAQEPITTLRLYNDRLAERRLLDMKRKQRKRAAQKAEASPQQEEMSSPTDLLEMVGIEPVPPPKKKAEKKPKEEKTKFAEFVLLTPSEYSKLVEKFGEEAAKACIEKLDNAKGAKGYKYKSDYRAILNWVVDDLKRTKPALFARSAPVRQYEDNPF